MLGASSTIQGRLARHRVLGRAQQGCGEARRLGALAAAMLQAGQHLRAEPGHIDHERIRRPVLDHQHVLALLLTWQKLVMGSTFCDVPLLRPFITLEQIALLDQLLLLEALMVMGVLHADAGRRLCLHLINGEEHGWLVMVLYAASLFALQELELRADRVSQATAICRCVVAEDIDN